MPRFLAALALLLAVLSPALAGSSGARHFNGTQYFQLGSSPVTAPPFTMACWFRADAPTDALGHPIIAVSRTSGGTAGQFDGWDMELDNSNVARHLFLYTGHTTTVGVAESTNTVPTTVGWHHAVAIITSSASRTILLDGAGAATDTTSITPAGVSDVTIGILLDNSGAVSESSTNNSSSHCAVWNVALTTAEGIQLSKGALPTTVRPAALKFWVPLWGLTSPEIDLILPAHPWVGIGSPTVTASGPPVADFLSQGP